MRRFTDSVLFIALFALDVLAWLILTATGGIDTADPTRIAPMTVGTIVVIACPALLLAAALGLIRALAKTEPRRFYLWSIGEAIVAAVCVALANIVTLSQGLQVGFGWMAWFFGILALAFVIAFVIALTGGISGPEEVATASRKETEGSSKKHLQPRSHHAHDEVGETAPSAPTSTTTPSVPSVPSTGPDTTSTTGAGTGTTSSPSSPSSTDGSQA